MNLIDFNKDVVSITDVGLVRQANEDNCYAAETPNGFLFVVCDGMGGHVGGARASAIAVNSIVNFFTKEYYAVIHQALADALVFANKQILSVAAENPDLQGMGTTACVVLMRDDKVWFAHIGDSRIYLFCDKEQQLHRLTKDHSVVQGLIDQGIISEAEAEHHPDKNRILKTLGIREDVQPEVCAKPVLPAKEDVFLICSDGLSGLVSDDILQHILTQKVSLQEKGENMLTFAKQAGGTDNITLQLIHISDSPHKRSVFESKNSSPASSQENKKRRFSPIIVALILTLIASATAIVFILIPKDSSASYPTTERKEQLSPKYKEPEIINETVKGKEFSIVIRRVYPNPNREPLFFGYNVEGEYKEDSLIQRNKYIREDANYEIEWTNGNTKTERIQNIKWIMVENGQESHPKSKPKLEELSYKNPTKVRIYACNNDGSEKKDKDSMDYDHYYKFYKNKVAQPIGIGKVEQSDYIPLEKCRKEANKCITENKNNNIFCEVRIFNDKGLVDSINNRKEHEQFQKEEQARKTTDAQKVSQTEEMKTLEKCVENLSKKPNDKDLKKRAFNAAMSCIHIDSNYSWENIDNNLHLCKQATDYVNDKTNAETIIKNLNSIINVMKTNPKNPNTFNGEGYFKNKKVTEIKNGIEELIRINNTLK